MVPGCGWQKYPDKTSKAVLIKCLPDKTSTPVLKKCLHDKTSKAGRSWKNVFLTKRPSWQNVHPDKTLILTKRLLTTILHCRVGIWPFFFVCQMLLKVPLCFDLFRLSRTKFNLSWKAFTFFIWQPTAIPSKTIAGGKLQQFWQMKLLPMSTFRISFQKIRTASFQLYRRWYLLMPYRTSIYTLHDMFCRS